MLEGIKAKAYGWAINRLAMRKGLRDYYDRHVFFYHACHLLSTNQIMGDYAEFGCHSGRTFAMASSEIKRWGMKAKLWAFDSFEGLPPAQNVGDEHPGWVPGSMRTSEDEFHSICRRNGISAGSYETVKGFYEDTLPGQTDPQDIALAYVDCDMYSSTVSGLDFLKPRLKQGMLLAFDDYFCMSADQAAGESRALREMVATETRFEIVPYRVFSSAGQAFVVEGKQQL